MRTSLRLMATACAVAVFMAGPAAMAADDDKETDRFGMKMSELRKLERKHKCKDMVRYREIIPYFGMETTKRVSKEIAIGVEKDDISAGRAKLVDVKYDCTPLLGNFYVNCTTDITLCYKEKSRH